MLETVQFRRFANFSVLFLTLSVAACGSSHGASHPKAVASGSATPSPTAAAPVHGPTITATAFGMHWLDPTRSTVAKLRFGSLRVVGGNAITWPLLQPTQDTTLSSSNPEVRALDALVATQRSRGVRPMITFGPTPTWIADAGPSCRHVDSTGHDWGTTTCAPLGDVSKPSNPWYAYVSFLAQRYAGKADFEMWNEPSLMNGYNGPLRKLAAMQGVAYGIVHHYGGRLVSASIPFTNGPPTNGYTWLRDFLRSPGGSSYDVLGVHLYPADGAARSGDGPEWSVTTGLTYARKAVADAGVPVRPIWDTEHNVGRVPAHTGYQGTAQGAAMLARTYLLLLSSGVQRVYWYAADDRAWSGTWLFGTDERTLTPAGTAYNVLDRLLVGAVASGCTVSANGLHVCRFRLASGSPMTAMWVPHGTAQAPVPAGAKRTMDVMGSTSSVGAARTVRVTTAPIYFTG